MRKNNLAQLRKLHSMTQEDLAGKVGVSRQAIAKWEAGETLPDIKKDGSWQRRWAYPWTT